MYRLYKQKHKFISIIVIFIGSFTIASQLKYPINNYDQPFDDFFLNQEFFEKKGKVSTYTMLDPLIIDDSGGGDYTWSQLSNETWCTGNGTANNPYIIENIAINGKNTSSCLEVKISYVYFIIRDSLFYNASTDLFNGSVILYSVRYGTLENNTIFNNDANGIYTWNSDFNKIIGNNISFNQKRSIFMHSDSTNNTIENNICHKNQETGINIYSSDNNIIRNNRISSNLGIGLFINLAENNTVKENIIYNNSGIGLEIYQSSHNNFLYGNDVSGNLNYGVYIQDCDNITVQNCNFTNGGSHGNFITNTKNITFQSCKIDNNGGHGIFIQHSDNFIVKECSITENIDSGIFCATNVRYSQFINNNISNNFDYGFRIYEMNSTMIMNNHITNNGDSGSENGLNFQHCNFISVVNNIIFNNYYKGISLAFSTFLNISFNTIKNHKDDGIYLYSQTGGNYGICRNISIFDNSIEDNGRYGIYIRNTDLFSNYLDIEENIFERNLDSAIFLDHSSTNQIERNSIINSSNYGIELEASKNNRIGFNTISHHKIDGIYCLNSSLNLIYSNRLFNNSNSIYLHFDSDNNSIYNNMIKKSRSNGLLINDALDPCDFNLIFKNQFVENKLHAKDRSRTNFWNSSEIGNYWDNYTGSDDNPLDGIGDTNHIINKGINPVIDYLPIWDDDDPQIKINHPNNNTRYPIYTPEFNVEIKDIYLESMWYLFEGTYRNISFTSNGTLDSLLWNTAWSPLNDGDQFILSFFANDTFGHFTSQDIIMIKDSFPIINLLSPDNNSEAVNLEYSLEIEDHSLSKTWLTIDGGDTKHFFDSNLTADLKALSDAWAAKGVGESILIEFFANDTYGQTSNLLFSLIKKAPQQSGGAIPGYDILIIFVSFLTFLGLSVKISIKKIVNSK